MDLINGLTGRVFTVLAGAMLLLLAGCDRHSETLPGFIAADITYVSSPVGGRLMQLGAEAGDLVKPTQLLYQLDSQPEQSQFEQHRQQWLAAKAAFADLKNGARKTIIDSLQADVKHARADYKLAKERYTSAKPLLKTGAVSQDLVFDYHRNLLNASAKLEQAQLAITEAMLGGREQSLQAAAATMQSSAAQMTQSAWLLAQKHVQAATEAQVEEVYFTAGEYVPANQPVLSLLVPRDLYVEFYLPQNLLPKVKIGDQATVSCEACKPGEVEVVYISPKAEYTPPVVYTPESSHQLVFKVKAHFATPSAAWHPGLPVQVTLHPGA